MDPTAKDKSKLKQKPSLLQFAILLRRTADEGERLRQHDRYTSLIIVCITDADYQVAAWRRRSSPATKNQQLDNYVYIPTVYRPGSQSIPQLCIYTYTYTSELGNNILYCNILQYILQYIVLCGRSLVVLQYYCVGGQLQYYCNILHNNTTNYVHISQDLYRKFRTVSIYK